MATKSDDLATALEHYQAASALHAQGKLTEAIESYRASLALNSADAVVHNSLGNALWICGKLREAMKSYHRAVVLNPNYAEAFVNLGNALQFHGKLKAAAACCQRALALNPDYEVAHNNLGNAWLTQGKLDEAIACYRRTVQLRPDYAEGQSNLANALQQVGQFQEAMARFGRALELRNDYPHAHYGRASLKLLLGDYEGGWPEYEWRLKTNEYVSRKFSEPRWNGEALEAETILLHAEGCLGDTLQFVRYASLVKKHSPSATVIVECQRPLLKMVASCPGIDRLVASGSELPPYDVQASLMSLPGILRTTLNSVPADVPYLFADAVLAEHWRQRLEDVRGIRIGINWHGRAMTQHRDLPIACIRSIAKLPGVRLISLQKREGAEELPAVDENCPPIVDLGDDFDKNNGAFMDTAAVMMNLNLVISSDTSIPHLAGALGMPVWLALPFVPDWRWLLRRADSPWYPTMRLFRQQHPGDWNSVTQEMLSALTAPA